MYPLAESALGPQHSPLFDKNLKKYHYGALLWGHPELITTKPRHFKVIKIFFHFMSRSPSLLDSSIERAAKHWDIPLVCPFDHWNILWLFKLFWTFYPCVHTEDDSYLKPNMFILRLEGSRVCNDCDVFHNHILVTIFKFWARHYFRHILPSQAQVTSEYFIKEY